MFVVYKCLKYNLRALFCVCVWVCLYVIRFFDGTSLLASFTICQKGSLTCPIHGMSLSPYPPKLCVPVYSE